MKVSDPIDRSKILSISFQKLTESDILILDLDVPKQSRIIGMSIETGYAKALGKKIISLRKRDKSVKYLCEIADIVVEYSDMKEVERKLPEAISKVNQTVGKTVRNTQLII